MASEEITQARKPMPMTLKTVTLTPKAAEKML